MKLSTNLNLDEITTKKWEDFSLAQQVLINNISTNVFQNIRDFLKVKIKVTSGVRQHPEDYDRLIAEGYNPSATSDHYFGDTVPTPEKKKAKYGEIYYFSVGALDLVPEMDVQQAFKRLVQRVKLKQLSVGQLIYEVHGSKKWIHVSNPYSLVFSSQFTSTLLNKPMFMESLDGGNTYKEVIL